MLYPTKLFKPRSQREVVHTRFYHPELDALRFLAFLAVFVHHALPREPGRYLEGGLSPAAIQWLLTVKDAGAYGVDLFFVLSSYLITELLLREHAARGTFSISAFYMRRALRIWPLYFVFLAATVFLIPLVVPEDRFGPMYIVSYLFFFGNWVCATNGLPFSVASPLWSISIEEQFYIGWPLLLLIFGVHRIKLLAIAMIVLAFGTRILLVAYGVDHPGIWCNTFARLDCIALGAILATSLNGRAPQIGNTVRFLLGGTGIAGFLVATKYLEQDGPTSIITYNITAVASVMVLIAVLHNTARFLLRRPFSWLVYLGRISYGLYVFHLLGLALAAKLMLVIPVSFELRVLLAFLITVILAAVSYRWLEQPFLRLKDRFTYTRKQPMPVESNGQEVKPPAADFVRAG